LKRRQIADFSQGNRPLSERFAIYFAPPAKSPLHLATSSWLGRDAWTGVALEQPAVADMRPERFS
jgi:hypothetical protein